MLPLELLNLKALTEQVHLIRFDFGNSKEIIYIFVHVQFRH